MSSSISSLALWCVIGLAITWFGRTKKRPVDNTAAHDTERSYMRGAPLLAVVGLIMLATFVWMNRYIYYKQGPMGIFIVRVNRVTGQACYLQTDGTWNSNRIAPPQSVNACN